MSGAIAFLPGLMFLTLPYTGFFDATHHWYSALAGTAALLVAIEKTTTARLIWAGALWGLATCFTQSVVVGALGLGVFLVSKWFRTGDPLRLLFQQEAYFLCSLVATLVAFNAYFVWKAGLKQFLYCTLVFSVKYYPADSFNRWTAYMASPPSIRVWSLWPNLTAFLLIHLLIPLIYVLFFVCIIARPGHNPKNHGTR